MKWSTSVCFIVLSLSLHTSAESVTSCLTNEQNTNQNCVTDSWTAFYREVASEPVVYTVSEQGEQLAVDGVSIALNSWSATSDNAFDIPTLLTPVSDDTAQSDAFISNFNTVLLSFEQAQTITGSIFSFTDLTESDSDNVTVVGVNNIGRFNQRSGDFTQSSAANRAVTPDNFGTKDAQIIYQSEFTNSKKAEYWLIGPYNSAFSKSGK